MVRTGLGDRPKRASWEHNLPLGRHQDPIQHTLDRVHLFISPREPSPTLAAIVEHVHTHPVDIRRALVSLLPNKVEVTNYYYRSSASLHLTL